MERDKLQKPPRVSIHQDYSEAGLVTYAELKKSADAHLKVFYKTTPVPIRKGDIIKKADTLYYVLDVVSDSWGDIFINVMKLTQNMKLYKRGGYDSWRCQVKPSINFNALKDVYIQRSNVSLESFSLT